MVDDILTITDSGHKTSRMNSFITAKIAMKKLQFGPKKCYVLHTGKEHEQYLNSELYVDGWSMKNVKNLKQENQPDKTYSKVKWRFLTLIQKNI